MLLWHSETAVATFAWTNSAQKVAIYSFLQNCNCALTYKVLYYFFAGKSVCGRFPLFNYKRAKMSSQVSYCNMFFYSTSIYHICVCDLFTSTLLDAVVSTEYRVYMRVNLHGYDQKHTVAYYYACEATSIPLSTHWVYKTLKSGRPGCMIGWLSGFGWTASSTDWIFMGYRKWIYPNRHHNCWEWLLK